MSHRSVLFGSAMAVLTLIQAPVRGADVFVATTSADYGTGSVAVLRDGSATAQVNLLNIHSDAVARYAGGVVYVINRAGQDNILLLDPAAPSSPQNQYSVGSGANPQDIAVLAADKAYLTLHERDYVLILDPASGAERGRIDLSVFADADGLPEAAEMVRVGDRVFVAIQRLDRQAFWAPAGDSYLAVIDIRTDSLVDVDPATPGVQGLRLAATNPGSIRAVGTQIVVQAVGSYMELDGGIEVIDAATLTSRGLLITEEQLGGQCAGLAMASATRGYTTVSIWPDHQVIPFDLSAGTVGPGLERHSGGYTPSIAVDGDRLLVADRGTETDLNAAGLLVYDAGTGAWLAGPISTGLPPSSIAVLSDTPTWTAVTDAGAAVPLRARLGAPYPNPFNAATQIPFVVESADTPIRLAIRDVLGRHVRTLVQGWVPAGARTVVWDGQDDAGRAAGNGVYVVELRAANAVRTSKVVLAK